jgi:hypothetical protein
MVFEVVEKKVQTEPTVVLIRPCEEGIFGEYDVLLGDSEPGEPVYLRLGSHSHAIYDLSLVVEVVAMVDGEG